MNRKKATSLIAIILVLLMVISLVASIIPATAYAVSQRDLDQIQQEKAQLSSRVQECQSRIDKLKEEQSNVLEQKLALDEQNRCANEQLALVAEEISIYNGMIEEKTKELEDAKEREETQLKRYRARVRAMEENGGYNILALIVNSGSFGEFLTAMDDMGEIMESDKTLERQYVAAREETEAVKAEYEEVREDYEEKHSQLKAEQAQLEKQIEDAYAALASLEEEIEEAIAEYKAAEAEEQAAAAAIRNIIAQINEQHRQEAANNGGADAGGSSSGGGDSGSGGGGGASGTGSFVWPVPCSTRVTSRFGPRVDPITGAAGTQHDGIDIDGFGNAGNAIVAADSGTVARAESMGGYGNCVIIDHGNYTQTLYAHMSGFAVSAGDWVEQGQTIGYLGDTGRATGVHCHFEIHINGGLVDPASYFTGLTYWNC